jgi:hypothetical protein
LVSGTPVTALSGDGRGAWGIAIDVPVSTVDRLEMRSAEGGVSTASLAG